MMFSLEGIVGIYIHSFYFRETHNFCAPHQPIMLADYDSGDEIQTQPMVDPNSQDLIGMTCEPQLLGLQCKSQTTGDLVGNSAALTLNEKGTHSTVNEPNPENTAVGDSHLSQSGIGFRRIDFSAINENERNRMITLPCPRNKNSLSSTLVPDLLQDYSESQRTESISPELTPIQDVKSTTSPLVFSGDIPTSLSDLNATIHVREVNCSECFNDDKLSRELERTPEVSRAGNNDSPLLTQLLNDPGPKSVTSPALRKFLNTASPERKNTQSNVNPFRSLPKSWAGRRRPKYKRPSSSTVFNKTLYGDLYKKRCYPTSRVPDRRFSAFSQVVPRNQSAPAPNNTDANLMSESSSVTFNNDNTCVIERYPAVKYLLEKSGPVSVQSRCSMMAPYNSSSPVPESPLIESTPSSNSQNIVLINPNSAEKIPSQDNIVGELLNDMELVANVNDVSEAEGALIKQTQDLLAQAVDESGLCDQPPLVMPPSDCVSNIEGRVANQDFANVFMSADHLINSNNINTPDSGGSNTAGAENITSIESAIDSALSANEMNDSVLDPDFFLSKDNNIPIEGSQNDNNELVEHHSECDGKCAPLSHNDLDLEGPRTSPSKPDIFPHSQSPESVSWFNLDKDVNLVGSSPGKVFENSDSDEEASLNQQNSLPSTCPGRRRSRSDSTRLDDCNLLDASIRLDYKSIHEELLLHKANELPAPQVEGEHDKIEDSLNITSHENAGLPDLPLLESTRRQEMAQVFQVTSAEDPNTVGDLSQPHRLEAVHEGVPPDENTNFSEVTENKRLPMQQICFEQTDNTLSTPHKQITPEMFQFVRMMAGSEHNSLSGSVSSRKSSTSFRPSPVPVYESLGFASDGKAPNANPLIQSAAQENKCLDIIENSHSPVLEPRVALDNSRDDCFIIGEDPPTMPMQVSLGSLSWLREALSRKNSNPPAKQMSRQICNPVQSSISKFGVQSQVSQNLNEPLQTQAAHLASKIAETNQEITSLDVRSGQLSVQMAAAPDHNLHQLHIQILDKQQKMRQKLSNMLEEYKTLYQMSQPPRNSPASNRQNEQNVAAILPRQERTLLPEGCSTDATVSPFRSSIPTDATVSPFRSGNTTDVTVSPFRSSNPTDATVSPFRSSNPTDATVSPFRSRNTTDATVTPFRSSNAFCQSGGSVIHARGFPHPVIQSPHSQNAGLVCDKDNSSDCEIIPDPEISIPDQLNRPLSAPLVGDNNPCWAESGFAVPDVPIESHSRQVVTDSIDTVCSRPNAGVPDIERYDWPHKSGTSSLRGILAAPPRVRPTSVVRPQRSAAAVHSVPAMPPTHLQHGRVGPVNYDNPSASLSVHPQQPMASVLATANQIRHRDPSQNRVPPVSSIPDRQLMNTTQPRPSATFHPQYPSMTGSNNAPGFFQPYSGLGQPMPYPIQGTMFSPFYGWGMFGTPVLGTGPGMVPSMCSGAVGMQYNNSYIQTAPTPYKQGRTRREAVYSRKRLSSKRKLIPISPKPVKIAPRPLAESEENLPLDANRGKSVSSPGTKEINPNLSRKDLSKIDSSRISDSNTESNSPRPTALSANLESKDEKYLQPPSVRRRKKPINPIGTPNKKDQESKKCPECKSIFLSLEELHKHRFSEHKQRFVYWCELCQKGYNDPRCIIEHKAGHEGRKFECQRCDKTFRSLTGYRRHQSEHTGDFLYKLVYFLLSDASGV